ncbi:ATP-binding protein [Ileibacterium valens]|uniref:sensor histidine kinase n=1 Tax=Ileibacterium valens TaxID=1862668 RepID=UPI003513928B
MMTKKIFYSIFSVSTLVFLLSMLLTFNALYSYYSRVEEQRLEDNFNLVEQGIKEHGEEYLENMKESDLRLTLISPDGKVLYDTKADVSNVENHEAREEVKEAIETGTGKSSRFSNTLTHMAYYYAKVLGDGNVLRLSVSTYSAIALFMAILPPLILIFLATLAVSMFLAIRLSRRIVAPLNELDLDHPEATHSYEELEPLMLRLCLQQKQIKSQKEEIEDRAKEFHVISNAVSEGLILLGPDLNVISINPVARAILNWSEETKHQPFLDFCPCKPISQLVLKAKEGSKQSEIIEWQDESWLTEVAPVLHAQEFQGCVLLMINVTSQQQAEKMRREFTGNVSHELKTPLQIISGYSELLCSGLTSMEDVPKFSEQILRESRRMTALINEILTLSYLDEAVNEESEPIDLYALSQNIIDELAMQAKKEKIHMKLDGSPAWIQGNPAMVRSILFNLIDNAIKYNRPEGSIRVQVSNSQSEEKREAIVRIEDTGLGILPSEQERIFERFYRVDKSRSRQKGGTGLGLSIVKHALRIHNGRIELSSVPDEGSVFTVSFPMVEMDTNSDQ